MTLAFGYLHLQATFLTLSVSRAHSIPFADVSGSLFPQSLLAWGMDWFYTLHPFRACEQRRNASFSGGVGIVASAGYANLPT